MNIRETWAWTAIITPFTANGSAVDYPTFGKLLKLQESAGNGVLILGSTGESLSLSEEEKQEIVRYTLALGLKVPVMIGLPNINLAQTLAWILFCRGKGAHAYLAATPLYTKPAAAGQCEWFKQVFDAVDAPIMLYNVPGRTASTLHPNVLTTLRDHKNFWAIKESSGGLDAYVDYATAAPNVALYSGDDNIFPCAVPLGACGLVSVAGNAWPQAVHAYVKASRNGSCRDTIWWKACKALFTTGNPVPVKALMKEIGLIPSDIVRTPLSRSDLANLDQLKEAHKTIEKWLADTKTQTKSAA